MKQLRSGFTLIEMLVAMAIFAILFVVISSITTSMTQSSRVINSKSRLTQEGQTVQRLLMGRISEAIYIFPPNTTLTLGTGATTQNSIAGTANWTVNRDPFIAMILPPESPVYAAGSNIPTNCTATISQGCYRFYAYYAVKRSSLTAAGLERSSVPPADPLNPNAWVLMQYQANLTSPATGPWTPGYAATAQGIAPAQINALLANTALWQSRPGLVLADYIQPQTGANVVFPAPPAGGVGPCVMFCVMTLPTPNAAATATTPATTRANDGTVALRFRMEQATRGLQKPIVINGTAPANDGISYIGGVVSPRNWWPAP